MVKALRSCLEAAKGKIKAGHLISEKAPREQLQDLLQPQIYPVYPFDMPDLQPASSGNIGIQDEPGDCQLLAKSLFEGEIVPKPPPVLSKAPEQGSGAPLLGPRIFRALSTSRFNP